MSSPSKAIGGYFELEMPKRRVDIISNSSMFNSARAAFADLVDKLAIKEVWLPRYLCNSMLDIFASRFVALKYYDLNRDFTIKGDIALVGDAILLYVNYFGLCDAQAKAVISEYGKAFVVIDNSQAWFSPPCDTLATIYSPRKFFGLPDGGVMYCMDPRVQTPAHRDASSETRMAHLISRIANSPEKSYQSFIEAEQSIAEMPVLAMSRLTERLLQSIDFESAKQARIRNARTLHSRLQKYNKLDVNIADDTAPLCYPLLPNRSMSSRADLIKSRIFVPSYWPEVLCRVEESGFESELVIDGLFLPCDQRYDEGDMERLISQLRIA